MSLLFASVAGVQWSGGGRGRATVPLLVSLVLYSALPLAHWVSLASLLEVTHVTNTVGGSYGLIVMLRCCLCRCCGG